VKRKIRSSTITAKSVFLFSALAITVGLANASGPTGGTAPTDIEEVLTALPTELKHDDAEPQTYRVTSYLNTRDISVALMNRVRTTEKCTRTKRDDRVLYTWSDVRIAGGAELAKPDAQGTLLPQMEGFSYEVSNEIMSCCRGTICVSLQDKQVEHFTINEDIILQMSFPGNVEKMLMNIQREVVFEKIM